MVAMNAMQSMLVRRGAPRRDQGRALPVRPVVVRQRRQRTFGSVLLRLVRGGIGAVRGSS